MIWIPKNKAEQTFKELFHSKTEMAKGLNVSRQTLDTYLSKPEKMNTQIKKISKLKNISQIELFMLINYDRTFI